MNIKVVWPQTTHKMLRPLPIKMQKRKILISNGIAGGEGVGRKDMQQQNQTKSRTIQK